LPAINDGEAVVDKRRATVPTDKLLSAARHAQVSNVLSLETPLYDLVGAKPKAMGHNVNSVSGEIMGGVQTLMYVPQPDGKFGYYRSGSEFRKDGQAVGW
jgi:gamma-glutamyltranspeptidase/glutathione hydrolase